MNADDWIAAHDAEYERSSAALRTITRADVPVCTTDDAADMLAHSPAYDSGEIRGRRTWDACGCGRRKDARSRRCKMCAAMEREAARR